MLWTTWKEHQSESTNMLKLDQFQNLTAAARIKMRNNDFCDVTLVSQDNQRIRAHKVILASVSTFFGNMLVNEMHHHPLIFMRGVEHKVLEALMDFIYSGETKLEKEFVRSFQRLIMELELFGITEEMLENDIARTKSCHPEEGKICKHWDKGYCKNHDCQYSHTTEDCEIHLSGNLCRSSKCRKRHRQMCRYWYDKGCDRKNQCAYLHQETITEKRRKSRIRESQRDRSNNEESERVRRNSDESQRDRRHSVESQRDRRNSVESQRDRRNSEESQRDRRNSEDSQRSHGSRNGGDRISQSSNNSSHNNVVTESVNDDEPFDMSRLDRWENGRNGE